MADHRGSPPASLADRIARAVENRLGGNPEIGRVVAAELERALADQTDLPPQPTRQGVSRVVVTAHGRNRVSIVARLAAAIDEFEGDIRDLSQTIVGDYFTILFVVDLAEAGPESGLFGRLRQRLKEIGGDLGIHVVVMHDDILASMHTI